MSKEEFPSEKNLEQKEKTSEPKAKKEADKGEEKKQEKNKQDQKLAKELADLKDKNKDLEDKYLRSEAEIQNMQNRYTKERAQLIKYESQSLAKDILPAMDNLERALSVEADDDVSKQLKKGVQMTLDALVKAMKDHGVVEIEADGVKFDPTLHQAVQTVAAENDDQKDHVVQVLQKGYQYNAPVGRSGLEYQYNDVLAGIAEESRITYDSNGLAKKEVIRQARKGNDIYLSIDIDLQQSLDTTLKAVLQENGGTERRENFYSLFMCMMDPYTGEVIALSGYQMDPDTRQMTYFASGNYMSLVNPGSSIKGATVYMGLSEGVIQPGEVINDEVMNIAGQEFGSYQDHGPVNDIQALSVSSNVYMFNIAIRLGGGTYQEGEPLNISNVSGTFDKMRSYYSMFGLGNITGLDVPGEVTGYMGVGREPGILLNYSIGQFDMYTPIQLLEYVSTIATNGLIYQPKLMSYVMEVNSEEIVSVNESVLKNTLPEENSEYLSRVQQGFRACVADGNCGVLRDFSVPVAGKTGTAEVNEWTTAAFVGWAPYEDADVSFACVAPTSSINDQSVATNICTTEVVPQVLQRYFELYPQ